MKVFTVLALALVWLALTLPDRLESLTPRRSRDCRWSWWRWSPSGCCSPAAPAPSSWWQRASCWAR